MFKVIKKQLLFDKLNKSSKFNVNICNPCLLKVPSWCKNKLGKYYLYFADHRGKYIKMAYSNSLDKNWKFKEDGIININKFNDAINHIASPEIYIDNKKKLIVLFTHSHSKSKIGQWTYVSISIDGINFYKVYNKILAPFYFRIFYYNNFFYGISKGGNLWKSKNYLNKFKQCQNLFDKKLSNEILHNYDGSVRHFSILIERNILYIFYTKIGDMPERIYYTSLKLNKDDANWKFKNEIELIRPTKKFEGSKLPLKKSKAGDTKKPENALRDPYMVKIYNNYYIFYCVKGEFGIAIAKINRINHIYEK